VVFIDVRGKFKPEEFFHTENNSDELNEAKEEVEQLTLVVMRS
jgi:hypothetical protein